MASQGPLENSDYQRPRRPSEETLSYIKSLPLDLKISGEEIERFLAAKSKSNKKNDEDDDDDHFPQLFAAALSAIDEIKTEIASLAGDEDGSQCVELLTRMTASYSELAVRKLLQGCSGYVLHLSTHRYGSHVLQSILQLATSFSTATNTDLARDVLDDDPFQEELQAVPSLSELILGVAEELTPHASQLAVHICGSHVLRTLLCVLAGIDLLAAPGSGSSAMADNNSMRRGKAKNKKKKKKKPVNSDNSQSSSNHAGLMHMVYRNPSDLRIAVVDDESFHAALDALAGALSGGNSRRPGELQKLASHPSAGPLLIVLLRVLTYVSCSDKEQWQSSSSENPQQTAASQRHLGIQPAQPKFELDSTAHTLAMKILCWPEAGSSSEEVFVPDIIYGLAGEPRGSHMLEALLRVSPEAFYESLLTYGDFYNRATLQEYIDDKVSNFVVQTLLCTIQTKEQAETILKAVLPIISSGSVIDPEKKRRGILWRAVELASKYRVSQEGILKAIRLGFVALQEDDSTSTKKESTAEEDSLKPKKKQRRKASTADLSSCIPQLLDAKTSEGDDGRVSLDVSGARTVYCMLRFAPRLCEETMKGILSYPPDMLELFAKDGLGSRCIWDGILDGPTESPCFSQGLQKLREKLSGRWVALSCDRVGQHVVKKIFRVSPEQERVKIAEELSHGVPRMSGSNMGRSVMDVCAVRDFTQGVETWKRAVKKASMQDDWLVLGKDDKAGTDKRKRKNSEDTSSKKKKKPRALAGSTEE